jgi:hypothetical protein
LLIEAVGRLVAAGVLLRALRLRRLAPRLGRHMAVSPEDGPTGDVVGEVQSVRWAIAAAARHLPWQPVCLPQAVAAQWMLRRRGIASTLYFGIAPGPEYQAHAWVRAGRVIVTGEPDQPAGMAVVSSFA